ncbi:hypothetical protein [Shewanella algae]|uniref:Uncharacterized protein n=1 Tax=Shewanella algae TaxID=38313 RepID=A0A380BGR5_9GAMM|nr:hypothetical protein [Shewanella algae]MBO2557604.1 hypothetical protein [Shewanella algae]MBO2574540.1 hypothetical protein [Shewanella algae]MBO2608567.1 hypothetical protein [Shewanella algae]SUJ00111.1 Uncharacterised protein [Shewanella algae]
MEIKELILYVLPALAMSGVVIALFAYRFSVQSRKFEDYKNDMFRKSVEKQITELSNQLMASQERFSSINHLLVDAQANVKNREGKTLDVSDSDFLENVGVDKSVKIDPRLIFVLTPFNEEFSSTYEAIKTTVEQLEFKCSRGDDAAVSHNILGHIIQEMLRSRLIIANISGRNSNVFYELGIAHAMGKQVLLLANGDSHIPFDLSHIRVLIYRDEIDLHKKLRNWFVHSLAETKPNKRVN